MGRTATIERKTPRTRLTRTGPDAKRQLGRKAKGVGKAGRKGRCALEPSGTSKKTARAKRIRTYQAALGYLNSLVNYEKRPAAIRGRGMPTLARTKKLLADLGDPHKSLRFVHIAGTKGKGSTATMLAHMLRGNGLKVGVYTSPHILDVRERIVVDNERIPESTLTRLMDRVARVALDYGDALPTYFETLTAIAFLYFLDQRVDIAVIETGLGGRFDATNVVRPDVCAITSISMDHTVELGDSLASIAAEKAGVFKEGVPVVSAPQPEEVKTVLRRSATEAKAPLFVTGEDITFTYRFESSRATGPQARICVTTPTSHFDHLAVPLIGKHQAINCGVAIGVVDQLKARGFDLHDEASITGLAGVRLEGRMETICENPRVLVDGAHNAASIEAVMRAVGQNIPYDSMVVIFGCCADKDINGMLRLIQLGADKIIFTRIRSPRSADPADLAARFAELSGRMAQVAETLSEALEIAEKAITREDLICITGSFYLVSEAKRLFMQRAATA